MGITFTRLFSSLVGNKEVRIVFLGRGNAGKTTIIYRLQGTGKVVPRDATIGFHFEEVHYKSINFQVWDVGGQTNIKLYWRSWFSTIHAIIYVVDSSDMNTLAYAKQEFHSILEEKEMKGVTILLFANKQDLPGALDDAEIIEALELHEVKNSRQFAIFKTCAVKGEGIFEGLDWLKSNALV